MHERHGATVGNKQPRLYRIWRAMRFRCEQPSHDCYQLYGGRGIKVCDEWKDSFSVFRRWALASGYRDDLTIDRKNNDGNYEPSNCRWISPIEQTKNKRPAKNEIRVERNGRVMSLLAWSRETGIGYTTLIKRYHAGLRGAALFKSPR